MKITKIAEVSLSRPAANERSPLRRPRRRSPTRMALKLGHQETFLELIRVGESRARATMRVGIASQTVDNWLIEDREFVRRYQEAQAEGRALVEGRVEGLLPKAVDVAEETLGNEDAKLKWDAAHKLLRGRGILRDVDQHAIVGNIVFRVKYDDDSKQGTDHSSKELPAPSSPSPIS